VDGMGQCDYYEYNRQCREHAAHRVQLDGKKLGLCDRHARREFHPPDLYKKLPGPLKRAARSLAG
jgi:hypothetical protein